MPTVFGKLGLRYRGRCREDYDLALAVIASGYRAGHLRTVAFAGPRCTGGMSEYYEGLQAIIEADVDYFVRLWQGLRFKTRKGRTAEARRVDVRVRWGAGLRLRVSQWHRRERAGFDPYAVGAEALVGDLASIGLIRGPSEPEPAAHEWPTPTCTSGARTRAVKRTRQP